MAQTIVILCDECLEGGTEVPGQTWHVALGAPGAKVAPYEVDACDMHAEPFRAMLKAVGEYGRRSDKRTPMPRVSTGGTSSPAGPVQAPSGEHACPVCGELSPSDSALSSHVKRRHGVSLAEAKGEANIECPEPECGRKLRAFQGLSAHLRSGHGYSAAQSRQAVEAAGGGHG